MTLTIRFLGVEFLHIELAESEETEAGDCSSTAIGFTAQLDMPDEAAHLRSRGFDE